MHDKAELGNMLLDMLPKRKLESVRPAIIWTLGRLGTRTPLYGPLNTVIDPSLAAKWARTILQTDLHDPAQPFALMQIARRTNDRYRDLPADTRQTVVKWMQEHKSPDHLIELVTDGGMLDTQEQQRAFGESLPKGLMLRVSG
jgi:hypothetical protein